MPRTRMTPVKEDELKKYPELYEQLPKPVPFFNRVLGQSPVALQGFTPLQKANNNLNLAEDIRKAIIVFISDLNGCEL